MTKEIISILCISCITVFSQSKYSGEYKIIRIDSIDYHYVINMLSIKDTTKKMIVVSSKSCNNKKDSIIKVNNTYFFDLHLTGMIRVGKALNDSLILNGRSFTINNVRISNNDFPFASQNLDGLSYRRLQHNSINYSLNKVASEEKKVFNFVILVNDRVLTNNYIKYKLIAQNEDNSKDTIYIDYTPGNLSMKVIDYEKLTDSKVKKIILQFEYTLNYNTYNYNLDIKKGWLDNHFYILYIYNTDIGKFKNLINPLEGKNYNFEFEYPGGGTSLIRKRNIKNR